MDDDDIFEPCVVDPGSHDKASPKYLGDYGDEAVISPAWEKLGSAKTAKEFYRAAAFLVFHAQHMHPVAHASLARLLQHPFKRRRGAPENNERREEIIAALQRGPFGMNHEWYGLSRVEMIQTIRECWSLTYDAARKAYDKAKRELAIRQQEQRITGRKET